MGAPAALAQGGYGSPPPDPRWNNPPGGYGNYTANPVPPTSASWGAYGGYNNAPGGYRVPPAPPTAPYGGNYLTGPATTQDSWRGYVPQPGSYSTAQPSSPYVGGYPADPSSPYQVYQRGYSTLAGPQPGVSSNAPLQAYGGYSAPVPTVSPVVALTDQLIAQADGFLQAFLPTARVVPEGRQFVADAVAVRDSAVRLRQAAAVGAPLAVTNEFAAVAANYQRLESRMYRVSRGRVGPNIANALQMGQTIQQIGALR